MEFNKKVDDFAEFLTSKALLLLTFMGFMAYRYYEVQQTFEVPLDDVWPSHVIGLVAIFTTLIFMVNASDLAPIPLKDDAGKVTGQLHWSKMVLVIYAFVINAFFWKPWEGEDIYDTSFRWFCCVMFSSMDYGFVHIFNQKQIRSGVLLDLKDLEKQCSAKSLELDKLIEEYNELEPIVKAHREIKAKCYCDACERTFGTPEGKNAHKCITNDK